MDTHYQTYLNLRANDTPRPFGDATSSAYQVLERLIFFSGGNYDIGTRLEFEDGTYWENMGRNFRFLPNDEYPHYPTIRHSTTITDREYERNIYLIVPVNERQVNN